MKKVLKHHIVAGSVLAALTLLAPEAAQAQSLRPNILVIFDTSGSMQLDDTSTWAGERVNEAAGSCPAVPAGKFSRLYSLKTALREALAQVGTDEANFGLMSFPQLSNPMQAFGCFQCTGPNCAEGPVGHYYVDPTVGLGCRLSMDPSNSFNFTGAEPAYGAWFDTALNQALRVDLTRVSPGTKPVAADFDPPDANLARIYKWIDNTEDAGMVANLADPELHGNGKTPLGRSLYYARLYYDNFIKVAADPKRACRQNIVILVTDGNDTCDSTSGSALNAQTCVQTGYATFHPEVQACKLLRTSNVKTYVITDTSVPGSLNSNIALYGGTVGAIRVSLTDTAAVKAALIGIIAETVPPAETCNGVDDNCNGLIDEGVRNMCMIVDPNNPNTPDNLLGTAAKHCAVEICNCLDDDCDGQKDEGFPTNACGEGCGCAIPLEICDGLDNNCNGDIDEGFQVGMSCTNGQQGACRRGGLLACKPDGTGTFCDAPVVTPSNEVCNNIDDNCNGQIDEGMLPGTGLMCGNNIGTCMSGLTVCRNGRLDCNAIRTPGTEICNGLDDNCDGAIDNGTFPMVGMTCLCAGLTQAQVDSGGLCRAGRYVCRGTMGIVCDGCVLPRPEICDGLDNDCDGMIDPAAPCPTGFMCQSGVCELQCGSGEFPCPAGYSCQGNICRPQRCLNVTCAANMKCDNDTGMCVGLCEKVNCASPKFCKAGQCVDCNDPGEECAAGQLCIGGTCKANPCAGVSCGEGEYCSNGSCVGLCSRLECDPNTQRCVAGVCVEDKCAQVGCSTSEFCDMATGTCKPNTCLVMQCPDGERCIESLGACRPDPCATIQCPAPCWLCTATSDGTGTCQLDGNNASCELLRTTTGAKGGGCACAVGPGASAFELTGGLGLMGLALLFATRRRRQR